MSSMQEDRETAASRPAVRWFLRLRGAESPALDPEELQQWEQFAADPANRQELAAVKELWRVVPTLGGPKMPSAAELDSDDFDDSMSVVQWMARSAAHKRTRPTSSGRPIKLLLAASLSAVAVAIGILSYAQHQLDLDSQQSMQAYATPIAEQRVLTLSDGSVVTLGARTEIQTRIAATERVIVLDRGEAWFKVAHDKQRPFRVFAGGGLITALGTEFNVRRDLDADLDRVTVTVSTGVVKVEPRRTAEPRATALRQLIAGRSDWEPAKLVQGQELSYEGAEERSQVKRADIEAAAAWKEGRLEYIHQPLKAVVARVNRYSKKPIVLADDAVGDLDYSGTVFEGQIDDWVRALHSAFPISIVEDDEQILIRSRE
jgi:transmembrane sensor